MSRRIRAVLAAAAVAAGLLSGAVGGSSSDAVVHAGRNPLANIVSAPAIGGLPCDPAPFSAACRGRLVAALDHARHVLGLPGYSLPGRFAYLTKQEKLLVLVNQDRSVYGQSHVYGLNHYLDVNAQYAATHRSDPQPVSTLAGVHWSMWTGNWAGGNGSYANPLTAHYNWMYYDGLNPDGSSWNLACHPYDTTLCWKHRDNILVSASSDQQLVMGIGAGPSGLGAYGYTHLFETVPASAKVNYVPSVVRESSRWAHRGGGKTITLGGFGFVRVTAVYVLGKRASVLSANPWTLKIRVPAHAPGSGHVVVHTAGGVSNTTYAAAFTYTR